MRMTHSTLGKVASDALPPSIIIMLPIDRRNIPSSTTRTHRNSSGRRWRIWNRGRTRRWLKNRTGIPMIGSTWRRRRRWYTRCRRRWRGYRWSRLNVVWSIWMMKLLENVFHRFSLYIIPYFPLSLLVNMCIYKSTSTTTVSPHTLSPIDGKKEKGIVERERGEGKLREVNIGGD